MENKITGNESAFGYGFANEQAHQEVPGLTKREYFAAMAMQGFSVQNLAVDRALNEKNNAQIEAVAQASVKLADAIISALNHQPINQQLP